MIQLLQTDHFIPLVEANDVDSCPVLPQRGESRHDATRRLVGFRVDTVLMDCLVHVFTIEGVGVQILGALTRWLDTLSSGLDLLVCEVIVVVVKLHDEDGVVLFVETVIEVFVRFCI